MSDFYMDYAPWEIEKVNPLVAHLESTCLARVLPRLLYSRRTKEIVGKVTCYSFEGFKVGLGIFLDGHVRIGMVGEPKEEMQKKLTELEGILEFERIVGAKWNKSYL